MRLSVFLFYFGFLALFFQPLSLRAAEEPAAEQDLYQSDALSACDLALAHSQNPLSIARILVKILGVANFSTLELPVMGKNLEQRIWGPAKLDRLFPLNTAGLPYAGSDGRYALRVRLQGHPSVFVSPRIFLHVARTVAQSRVHWAGAREATLPWEKSAAELSLPEAVRTWLGASLLEAATLPVHQKTLTLKELSGVFADLVRLGKFGKRGSELLRSEAAAREMTVEEVREDVVLAFSGGNEAFQKIFERIQHEVRAFGADAEAKDWVYRQGEQGRLDLNELSEVLGFYHQLKGSDFSWAGVPQDDPVLRQAVMRLLGRRTQSLIRNLNFRDPGAQEAVHILIDEFGHNEASAESVVNLVR